MKGFYRQKVGTAAINGKLTGKILYGKEEMAQIKALLLFSVATLHLAVVACGERANLLVVDA